jgi:formamidopyrimidine-DNA glycosylase
VPELPEVETVRRDLAAVVPGRRIAAIEVTGARSVRRHDSDEFVARLRGRSIGGVRRLGKYLLVELDDDELLVIHLRMSGQLLLTDGATDRVKHTHVVVRFDGHADELRFVDPRTFGEWFLTTHGGAGLSHIGPDALDGVASAGQLGSIVTSRKRKLKDLLMDQTVIAGIGNIYSDEILFTAGLRYDRLSNTLADGEVARLFTATRDVLTEAIEHRGSSLADEQYRDLYGNVGSYATRHRVFAREAQPCRTCASPIVRIRYGGRSHFFCEVCQA